MKLKEMMVELEGLKGELQVWHHMVNYLSKYVGSEMAEPAETMRGEGGHDVPVAVVQGVIDEVNNMKIAPIEKRFGEINDIEVSYGKITAKKKTTKEGGPEESAGESGQKGDREAQGQGRREAKPIGNAGIRRGKTLGVGVRRQPKPDQVSE